MELVKRLLLIIESQEDDSTELILSEDMDKNVVAYHLEILDQAGYTKSNVQFADDNPLWIHSSLTWEGHEFLSAIRSDEAVGLAEKEAEKKGTKLNELPFEVVKALTVASAKQMFGL